MINIPQAKYISHKKSWNIEFENAVGVELVDGPDDLIFDEDEKLIISERPPFTQLKTVRVLFRVTYEVN